jgi:hypothetical protein
MRKPSEWKVVTMRTFAVLAFQQLAGAFLHFLRRLVGEGDGGDAGGLEAAFADEPGDLVGDHPGLARTRARQHQQRAIQVFRGFALGWVEMRQHGMRQENRRTIVSFE